jgi:hypothetical protein
MKRLAHLIVLAAFIFSCGGNWYLLQGIAWVKMIHDYSQFVPLTEAVGMTLSGKYPCALCQALAEKKPSENNQTWLVEKYEKKFFPPIAVTAAKEPAEVSLDYFVPADHVLTRAETPPTPPPRLSLS